MFSKKVGKRGTELDLQNIINTIANSNSSSGSNSKKLASLPSNVHAKNNINTNINGNTIQHKLKQKNDYNAGDNLKERSNLNGKVLTKEVNIQNMVQQKSTNNVQTRSQDSNSASEIVQVYDVIFAINEDDICIGDIQKENAILCSDNTVDNNNVVIEI